MAETPKEMNSQRQNVGRARHRTRAVVGLDKEGVIFLLAVKQRGETKEHCESEGGGAGRRRGRHLWSLTTMKEREIERTRGKGTGKGDTDRKSTRLNSSHIPL